MTGRLRSVMFPGPAGVLEGLWKDASVRRRGSGVFAHPHPLHGGTMHSKVVYRAAQALTRSGYATLRFNFRGVGLSEGNHDGGRGEVGDFRAALDEAGRQAGPPIVAGGFSFGSAIALRAIRGDPRIEAFIAVGLPVATESVRTFPRPRVPALFVVGERDTFGPPVALSEFVGSSGSVVVLPDTSHFLEGRLEALEGAIESFLARLPQPVTAAEEGNAS